MKENLTGLFISGLLHAGILGVVANANYIPEKDKEPKTHQLTVSMFQAEKKPIVVPPVLTQRLPKVVETKKKDVVKLPKESPKKPPEIKPDVKPIVVAAVEPQIAQKKIVTKKEKPISRKAVVEPTKPKKPVVIKQKLTPKKKRVKRKPKIKKKVLVKRPRKAIQKPVRRVVQKTQRKPRLSKPIVRARPQPRPRPKVIARPRAKPKPKLRPIVRRPRVQPKQQRRVAVRARQKHPQYRPQHRPPVRQQQTRRRPPQRPYVRHKPVVQAKRTSPVRKHVKTGGVVNKRRVVRRPVVVKKRINQQAIKTRQIHKKPAQHHARPPVKRVVPSNNAQVRQYKARLHQIIAGLAKKHYPKRARRRNQQGRVTLSFSISHSGTVSNVKILVGSGFSVLDKAAIKVIQQVSRQLPFLNGMPKNALSLKMTVVYALQ